MGVKQQMIEQENNVLLGKIITIMKRRNKSVYDAR